MNNLTPSEALQQILQQTAAGNYVLPAAPAAAASIPGATNTLALQNGASNQQPATTTSADGCTITLGVHAQPGSTLAAPPPPPRPPAPPQPPSLLLAPHLVPPAGAASSATPHLPPAADGPPPPPPGPPPPHALFLGPTSPSTPPPRPWPQPPAPPHPHPPPTLAPPPPLEGPPPPAAGSPGAQLALLLGTGASLSPALEPPPFQARAELTAILAASASTPLSLVASPSRPAGSTVAQPRRGREYVPFREYQAGLAVGGEEDLPSLAHLGLAGDELDGADPADLARAASPEFATRLALPTMSGAPVDRELQKREKAAIEFVNAGIAPITAMRQALDTDGSLGATDATSILADYVAHLSGWSPGWLDQCRGTALALYAHSTGAPQPTHVPNDALFHTRVAGNDVSNFLATRKPSAVQGTLTRIRWLARAAGLSQINAFSAGSVGSRKRARLEERKAAADHAAATPAPAPGTVAEKGARPFDLDEYLHLHHFVADAAQPELARMFTAQVIHMIEASLRKVSADRYGNVSASDYFLSGEIAFDPKKTGSPAVGKLAMRHTVFGFDFAPLLIDSLRGIGGAGFLLRDFNGADPMVATSWLDELIGDRRFLLGVRTILVTACDYGDGVQRRPPETRERLLSIKMHSARNTIPAFGGAAMLEAPAINELGPWSGSTAETVPVPTLGRLSDLIISRPAAGPQRSYAIALGYAAHGAAQAATPLHRVLLRIRHVITSMTDTMASPDVESVARDDGWLRLRRAAGDPTLAPPLASAPALALAPPASADALALPAPTVPGAAHATPSADALGSPATPMASLPLAVASASRPPPAMPPPAGTPSSGESGGSVADSSASRPTPAEPPPVGTPSSIASLESIAAALFNSGSSLDSFNAEEHGWVIP
jgi:hypothetical protein